MLPDANSDDNDRSRYVTPVGAADPAAVAEFWERAVAACGLDPTLSVPAAGCFGDTVELADELIELVLHGDKRATAGALEEFGATGELLPVVGGYCIATDGAMLPRAVLYTTDIRIGPLSSVDEQFAWDEGEGDRTRAWWLEAHTWYFTTTAERTGIEFRPDMPTVFERFTVTYQEA